MRDRQRVSGTLQLGSIDGIATSLSFSMERKAAELTQLAISHASYKRDVNAYDPSFTCLTTQEICLPIGPGSKRKIDRYGSNLKRLNSGFANQQDIPKSGPQRPRAGPTLAVGLHAPTIRDCSLDESDTYQRQENNFHGDRYCHGKSGSMNSIVHERDCRYLDSSDVLKIHQHTPQYNEELLFASGRSQVHPSLHNSFQPRGRSQDASA